MEKRDRGIRRVGLATKKIHSCREGTIRNEKRVSDSGWVKM